MRVVSQKQFCNLKFKKFDGVEYLLTYHFLFYKFQEMQCTTQFQLFKAKKISICPEPFSVECQGHFCVIVPNKYIIDGEYVDIYYKGCISANEQGEQKLSVKNIFNSLLRYYLYRWDKSMSMRLRTTYATQIFVTLILKLLWMQQQMQVQYQTMERMVQSLTAFKSSFCSLFF